jgi:hypothetical protein
VKRCKACRVTIIIAEEEVASHECEELNFVRLELDHHVRLDAPHYLEFTLEEIFVHSNHMITTINATSVQINYFYNYSLVNPMCNFSRKCV